MVRLATIVEGHGEVEAVPVLVRRIAAQLDPERIPDLLKPIRVPKRRLLKEGELERTVELAARQSGPGGRILILLDADEDCPKDQADEIRRRASECRADRTIRVVLAKTEYEAWFLAAAESIAGRRGIDPDMVAPRDPESVRGAKEWLSARMGPDRSYRETLDQVKLTAHFDMSVARRAPSFDKMWRDVESLLIENDGDEDG